MRRKRRGPPSLSSAEGVTIEDAYNDLTREAFAVWIRMMIEPEQVLQKTGVLKLARTFNYGKRAFRDIIGQLRNKGYIRVLALTPFVPGEIHLTKRAMLVGRDHFIKLS